MEGAFDPVAHSSSWKARSPWDEGAFPGGQGAAHPRSGSLIPARPMTRPTNGRIGAAGREERLGPSSASGPFDSFSISHRSAGVELQERGDHERSGEASRCAAPQASGLGAKKHRRGGVNRRVADWPEPRCGNRTRIPSGVIRRVVRVNGFAGSSGPSGRRWGEESVANESPLRENRKSPNPVGLGRGDRKVAHPAHISGACTRTIHIPYSANRGPRLGGAQNRDNR